MSEIFLVNKVTLQLGAGPEILFKELMMRLNADKAAILKVAYVLLDEVTEIYEIDGWRVFLRNRNFPDEVLIINPVKQFLESTPAEDTAHDVAGTLEIPVDQEAGISLEALMLKFGRNANFATQYAIGLLLKLIFQHNTSEGWFLMAEHISGEIKEIESYRALVS